MNNECVFLNQFWPIWIWWIRFRLNSFQKSDFCGYDILSVNLKKSFENWKSRIWHRNQSLHNNLLRILIWGQFKNRKFRNFDLRISIFFRLLRATYFQSIWRKILNIENHFFEIEIKACIMIYSEFWFETNLSIESSATLIWKSLIFFQGSEC